MRKRKSAFTLLELLIASGISTLLLVGIYSAFSTGVLGYKKIESAFAPYQAARIILGRIELELKNSFVYRAEDSGFNGQKSAMIFFTVADRYEKGEVQSDLCLVKYSARGEELNRILYVNKDALVQAEGAQAIATAHKIKDVSFSYASVTSGAGKKIQWQPVWPGDEAQKTTLPLAVRIKLTLQANEGGMVEFNKLVALPLTK